jgi:glycosyltransferase involved in cell wall biosynthesis
MSDLVSILIPAYKVETLVAETVRSAENQTWPRKEIIVVDDGSPDRTYEVAKRFQSRSVKVVRQDNGGAPAARNTALSLAQGDYIQWLDADDLLHPEKISKQLHGADSGVDSRTFLTCSWGRFFFDANRADFVRDSLWRDYAPIDWIVTKFADNVWMNPAVWLVSRKLTDLAGPWDNRLARSGDDDGEYVCRVVEHSDGVRFSEDAQCYYRIGTVGSLNWNMETSTEAQKSLVLSLKLSIEHLLRMENSDRTRQAAMSYLRAFLQYFYGCDDGLYAELRDFAFDRLGSDLEAPSVSWKYRPLEAVAGPRFTKKAIANWRGTKMLLRGRFEQMLPRRSVPVA